MSEVINLFDRKKAEEPEEKTIKEETEEVSFAETMRRNKANADRIKKERAQANKGVIRSHRLK